MTSGRNSSGSGIAAEFGRLAAPDVAEEQDVLVVSASWPVTRSSPSVFARRAMRAAGRGGLDVPGIVGRKRLLEVESREDAEDVAGGACLTSDTAG